MEDVTKEYADCLTGMGYSKQWRVNVLMSALRGYQGILQLVDQGKVKRNRFGKATATARRFRKLLGPSKWYKKQGAQNGSGPGRHKGQQGQRGNSFCMLGSQTRSGQTHTSTREFASMRRMKGFSRGLGSQKAGSRT